MYSVNNVLKCTIWFTLILGVTPYCRYRLNEMQSDFIFIQVQREAAYNEPQIERLRKALAHTKFILHRCNKYNLHVFFIKTTGKKSLIYDENSVKIRCVV